MLSCIFPTMLGKTNLTINDEAIECCFMKKPGENLCRLCVLCEPWICKIRPVYKIEGNVGKGE